MRVGSGLSRITRIKVVPMFGFKKTSELDRLRAVYADQSDHELLRLHAEREGLTDAGRQALDDEMEQRGLDASAKAEPQVAAAGRLEADNSELTSEEVELWTFPDTYQIQTLIALLQEASIPFRLLDHSEQKWAGLRGSRQIGITVVVPGSREVEAKALLRQVLFGVADHEEPAEIAFRPPRGLVLLLTCERAEGLAIVQALSEAGISFYWRDGREDNEVPGIDGIALEVQSAQHAQAEEVVHAWMAAQAAADSEDLATEV
jgi:hypothetical protein